MYNLNFNIYAFVKPETQEELNALIEEAVLTAAQLECQLDTISTFLRNNTKTDIIPK